MINTALRKSVRALPVAQRIELVDELVHSIAADQRDLPIPAWQKKILKERMEQYEANPKDVMSHAQFKAKIRQAVNRRRMGTKREIG